MENYSVLMTVYYKEKAQNLEVSMRSIFNQTYPTNDFVLVCDGKLTDELDAVVNSFKRKYYTQLNIIRLEQNVGTGNARNIGIKSCKNNLIAVMDSDDYAFPERCEHQVACFETDKNLSILGGQMSEFEGAFTNTVAIKRVPTAIDDIMKYAKRRDPFNGITVMFKKDAVIKAGMYPPLTRCEDYYLYAKMLRMGFYGENSNEIYSACRLDKDTFERRGSIENLRGFVSVRWKIHKMGFSSFWDFCIPCLAQVVYTCLPLSAKKFAYQKVIRRERSDGMK